MGGRAGVTLQPPALPVGFLHQGQGIVFLVMNLSFAATFLRSATQNVLVASTRILSAWFYPKILVLTAPSEQRRTLDLELPAGEARVCVGVVVAVRRAANLARHCRFARVAQLTVACENQS